MGNQIYLEQYKNHCDQTKIEVDLDYIFRNKEQMALFRSKY